MKNGRSLFMAVLTLVTPAAWAQSQPHVEMTKSLGHAAIARTIQVTATVEHIDPSTRIIVLKTPHKIIEVEVGEDARNFDQLKVGDAVTAVYRDSLSLSLKKNGGQALATEEKPTLQRAPQGSRPGGTLGREVTVVADVIAVHPQSQIVTLKGPQGNTVDLVVEDPEQLANIRKGDQVQAVYTEALAISVEPAVRK